jgi:hypothetical protein
MYRYDWSNHTDQLVDYVAEVRRICIFEMVLKMKSYLVFHENAKAGCMSLLRGP